MSLSDLYFELSNEDRVNILNILSEDPLNLTKLSKRLDITNQECSRHLSRLIEAKLINKTPETQYQTSQFGELILRTKRGQSFIFKHRDYFNSHSLSSIPTVFVNRIGELSESQYVGDVMVVFQNIDRMFKEAEEYAFRITDQYLLLAVPSSLAATKTGLNFKIITNKNIDYPPEFEKTTTPFQKLMQEGYFTPKEQGQVDVFLAMSEQEVAALSFPDISGKYDYIGFSSKDSSTVKWCKDLFEYYWDMAEPKLDLPWM